jgi:uncharacterized Zn finger protein (UPF0148 family)
MKIFEEMPQRRWCPTCRAKQVFVELANGTLKCPVCQAVLTEEDLEKATQAETDRLLRIGRHQL